VSRSAAHRTTRQAGAEDLFAFQETRAAVDVAFTDRHGGLSGGPYASLNLASSGGEDPETVEANIDIVVRAFASGSAASGGGVRRSRETPAPRVALMRQVHGAEVVVVGAPAAGVPTCDALVTVTRGVTLMVRVADCAPVLLADVERNVVGAAHAGRAGMVAGVLANTVSAMRVLGARDITAWVGPHVCGRCYEVPEQMRAEVARAVPEAYAETSWGTPAVDIGRGVRAQLDGLGAWVVDATRCTVEDEDLFSYRRQGTESGRLAGLIRVRA